jgi:lysophospholipase L1-like esterase
MYRCVLILLSASLTLCAVELTLRIVVDRYRCDDRVGWTYEPRKLALVFNWTREFVHFVRFNQDGLRDREPPTKLDVNAFRIVVLGDSFSAGLQVQAEESFPKLLETRLRAATVKGRKIEVWNAAVDGYGTAQALRMFIDRVARYQPKLVLLGLFLANDLADNVVGAGSLNHYLALRCGRPYFKLDHNSRLVVTQGGHPVRLSSSALDHFLRRSELYANLFPVSSSVSPTFADWDIFTGKNSKVVAAAWKLTRALVRELDRQVQARGARLIVLLIPHEQECRVGRQVTGARFNSMNFERAHELAKKFFHESRILYIDLYPSLRDAMAEGERPYFRRDMHWNSLGHWIVADAIYDWLVRHGPVFGVPLVQN